MKKIKRLFALVLTLAMICTASITASASSKINYGTFKSGMTIAAESNTFYKVTVTDNSYYKVTLNKSESYQCYLWICTHKPTYDEMMGSVSGSVAGVKMLYLGGRTQIFTLKPGTYWIRVQSQSKSTISKLNYKYNKTFSNAAALKAGSFVTDIQTAYHTGYAWHKITITKAQVLTIYTKNSGDVALNKGAACPYIKVYTAKKKAIALKYTGNKQSFYDGTYAKFTTVKLAKGTYYIRCGDAASTLEKSTKNSPVCYFGYSFKWN